MNIYIYFIYNFMNIILKIYYNIYTKKYILKINNIYKFIIILIK